MYLLNLTTSFGNVLLYGWAYIIQCQSARLMIRKSWVRIHGRSAERIFFSELKLCTDLFRHPFHPAVAPKRPWSFCRNHSWQVTAKRAYTIDATKSERADYGIQAQSGNPSGKRTHSCLSSLSHCGLIPAYKGKGKITKNNNNKNPKQQQQQQQKTTTTTTTKTQLWNESSNYANLCP